MTTVVVLGAEGFIGRAFCQAVPEGTESGDSWRVVRADVAAPDATDAVRLDATDAHAVERLLVSLRPRVIVNLVGLGAGSPEALERANVALPDLLLKLVAETPSLRGARVVLMGSAAEYGDNGLEVQDERAPLRPVSAYGKSKVRQLDRFNVAVGSGVDAVLARPFNIIGAGMPKHLSIPTFVERIARAETGGVLETGSLVSIRDYVDVRDVASALWSILARGVAGEVYNVCSGVGVSMRSIVDTMNAISGKNLSVAEAPKADPGVLVSVGSPAKLRALSGWTPQIPLAQSIRELMA